MKKKLIITLLILSSSISIAQNLIAKPRTTQDEVNNLYSLQKNSSSGNQKLPYPIIFIHGLNSSSDVWIDLGTNLISSGLSFGGRIDFCLNDDGNNYTSNKLVYPTANADIAYYTNYVTDLTVADFYFLNFNVDNFGRLPNNTNFNDVLSNESAIAKQGVALKIAIQMVLLKTGRDKVILMGHSMGGLASREYIQNISNWQNDGQHHVAKLITTGTPHGGYTGTNNQTVTGIDGQSEAYRDLRKSYSWSGYDGVYLYGGTENSSVIKNNLLYPFYNVDINCNGINEDNSNVIGLNQRQWITDIDYSYIVGVCTNCSLLQGTVEGDGIVRSENANLSNFTNQLPTPKNEFIYTADAVDFYIGLHSDLPKAIPVSMQGLDEPNEYSLAYGIVLDQQYEGFITQQPTNGYQYDYDDYAFSLTNNGSINVVINNSFNGNLPFRILNSNFISVYSNSVDANTSNTYTIPLNAGQYYIEFYAAPTNTSYLNPYIFIIQNALSNDDRMVSNNITVYPNPTNSKINIKSESKFDEVEIYTVIGQKVISNKISENQEIDLSELTSGTYLIKLKCDGLIKCIKIIKE